MNLFVESDLLATIPLFAKLSPADRADLQGLMQPREVDANTPIFWIGEKGDEFFVIRDGTVTISVPDESGKEVTLATMGPGDFFGELSLLDGGRRTATARGETTVVLLALGRDAFHSFVMKHPSSAIHMMTVLGRRQRETVERLRGLRNVNEAVDEKLTRTQRLFQRVAAVGASEIFLLANLLFFIAWISINSYRYAAAHRADPKGIPAVSLLDAPPTFFWLGFLVTLEAIVLSMFVLNSQKRQAERDSIKADLDYQVNRKAQLEIMELHAKVDRLHAVLAKTSGDPDADEARST